MQEGDVESFGTLARRFVDQLHPLARHFIQTGLQTIDSKCQVVDAFAFLFDELADRAFRIGRFEQFDLRLTDLEEGGTNLLFLDFLDGVALQTKLFFPEGNGLVQAFDGNAEVFDMRDVHGYFLSLR